MKITFNYSLLMVNLRRELTKALVVLQKELLDEARQGMKTPEGAKDLDAETIKDVAGVISALVIGGPWAIIDEFGTGSLMDTSNPFLDEYRNSALWNPARPDNVIRGRPAGTQPTMFGERTFEGNAPGVDLERLARAGVISEEYLPQPPSKALRTAARWMANGRFQKVIKGILETFPWGKYLVIR